MTDFINKFDRTYHKLKHHKMELPDGVLACRLLTSANLSEQYEPLATATLTELTYDNMKRQLKKIFGDHYHQRMCLICHQLKLSQFSKKMEMKKYY